MIVFPQTAWPAASNAVKGQFQLVTWPF